MGANTQLGDLRFQMPFSDSPSRLTVTHDDITAGLRALGLRHGDGLMLHSSLKSFGLVQGGPRTIILALMEVLSPEGTLLMPSFNHGAPFQAGGPGYYAPLETPTRNGIIPDTFWRTPGVLRSLDPTHAFCAWGRHAERYVAFHHRTLTMGPGSPLGLLCADDGYALLAGVDYRPNTFHHVVEMSTGAPCLGLRTEEYPVLLPDGRTVKGRTWGWRQRACPLTDQNRYADLMRSRQLQREVVVGGSHLILYRLQDCFRVVAEVLSEGRGAFPPCSRCTIRPRRVPQTVPSDWDTATGTLKPDSVAWSY
jgi:aminoglycoside 3-N-acetyltransferase